MSGMVACNAICENADLYSFSGIHVSSAPVSMRYLTLCPLVVTMISGDDDDTERTVPKNPYSVSLYVCE